MLVGPRQLLRRLALLALTATVLAACGSAEQLKQTASSAATKAKTELASLTASATGTATTTATAPAHTTSVNNGSTNVTIQPISTPVATESASEVAWWVWVLIGLGAVGVVILIFQLGRGHRSDERAGPQAPSDPRVPPDAPA